MSRETENSQSASLSRRLMLGAATIGSVRLAARAVAAPRGFGNPDAPAEGLLNAAVASASSNPGPRNPALAAQFPQTENPPATDINGLPQFWASFNNAHRRQQNGGWARQVTQDDFAISTEISGVNMRLSAGGIREMHWHQQAEWAFVTNGTIRVTVLDARGRAQVGDVHAGGLWYFAAGLPHSLQGMGPDGGEFILVFDNGRSSEFNTLLLTDWIAHTPPDILAKNFGVPAQAFSKIPLDNLWIFQGTEPGSAAADQQEVGGSANLPPESLVFDLAGMKPTKTTAGGSVKIADSATNFHASKTIAVAEVRLEPGGLREMHWHPNADEWQYYVKGQARMTVFNTGPKAQTEDFRPGDIGYIPKALGHYVENIGNDELVFLEIFRTGRYEEISLNDWLTNTPKAMVEATLNISSQTIARFPRGTPDVLPGHG